LQSEKRADFARCDEISNPYPEKNRIQNEPRTMEP
jgi:hypothetical protein